MAYTKTNWQTGDVIDATKLNHAEDGIAQAQQTADTANARDSLADLTDVEITGTPTDGQVVMYDATNSKWVNGSAGGGVKYINVFDATNNKLNKTCEEMLELYTQAILYCDFNKTWSLSGHSVYPGKYNLTSIYNNGTTYYFVFQRIIFRGYLNDSGKPSLRDIFPSSLEISDLPYTKSNDGQILQYNRTQASWNAVNPTMSILTDVSISSPATGQVLKYNGTKWVNGTATSMSMAYLTYYKDDNGDYGDAGVMYMAYAGNPSDTPSILDVAGLQSFLSQSICTGIDIYDTTTMDGSHIGSTTSITLVESTGDVYVGDSHLSNHYKADGSGKLVLQTS